MSASLLISSLIARGYERLDGVSLRAVLLDRTALSGMIALSILGVISRAEANPQGGAVVGGDATISQTAPNQVTINQATNRAIINWQSFGIGAGEHTQFVQPSSASIALNRVLGGSRSDILGRLSANGQVWLVNPSGVFFGPNAVIDVAGLLATTHNIKNEDFMAGRYVFQSDTQPAGIIENQGLITAKDAGLVAFVAAGVVNHGIITARLGEVTLAAGNAFTIDFTGRQLINLAMDRKVTQQVLGNDGNPLPSLVHNDGKIFADGGRIQLTATAAKGIVDKVVNVGGIVQARSVEQRNGEIILSGGDSGIVEVTGTLDASGRGPGQTGGNVLVLGEKIGLLAGARIDVSGAAGGGDVLVGGEFRGGNATDAEYAEFAIRPTRKPPVPNASVVYVDRNAVITADATDAGKGGKVVVWADGTTRMLGSISAQGGANGGDGGFIETSAHYLDVNGAQATAAAPRGRVGNWLLDPWDLYIVGGASNINPVTSTSASYTSGSGASNVKDTDLATWLNTMNVTLKTGGTAGDGNGNGDIFVNVPLNFTNIKYLTLDALRNIYVNNNISVNNSGGGYGGVTFTAQGYQVASGVTISMLGSTSQFYDGAFSTAGPFTR